MSRKRWDEVVQRLNKRQSTKVAEVGVWTGKMSERMLRMAPNMTLWMIDRWAAPAADDSYASSGSEISARGQNVHDAAYHKCCNIAQSFKGRAHILKSDSSEAAEQFNDGFFDVVFIDGDHSYDGCRRDILAWRSKVKAGGWLGGHDYDHPDQGEVKRAVDEIFPHIVLGENRTWWVKL